MPFFGPGGIAADAKNWALGEESTSHHLDDSSVDRLLVEVPFTIFGRYVMRIFPQNSSVDINCGDKLRRLPGIAWNWAIDRANSKAVNPKIQ